MFGRVRHGLPGRARCLGMGIWILVRMAGRRSMSLTSKEKIRFRRNLEDGETIERWVEPLLVEAGETLPGRDRAATTPASLPGR